MMSYSPFTPAPMMSVTHMDMSLPPVAEQEVISISDDTPVVSPKHFKPSRKLPRLTSGHCRKMVPQSGTPFFKVCLEFDCSDYYALRLHLDAMRSAFVRSTFTQHHLHGPFDRTLSDAIGVYSDPSALDTDFCYMSPNKVTNGNVKIRYLPDGESEESESSEINGLSFAPLQ